MKPYYIFGSENFDTLNFNLDLDNNKVLLEFGDHKTIQYKSWYKLDAFKKELEDFIKHLNKLEGWKNNGR